MVTTEAPLWIVHGPGAPSDRRTTFRDDGVRLLEAAAGPQGLDPAAMLAALGAEGLTRVYCEGGGSLAAALLGADLVDELIGFTAGLAIGAEGRPAFGAMGLATLSEALRFTLVESRALAGDVMHRWQRRGAPA